MSGRIDKADPAIRHQIAKRFMQAIPHNRAIGLDLIDVDSPEVQTRLAYREAFLGDRQAGLWHTAIATTAADSTCGLAVFLCLSGLEVIATLDLRMDYLRPAVAGRSLDVVAHCHHLTRHVAFVTATLYQHDPDRPTARCNASFMRTGGSSVLP